MSSRNARILACLAILCPVLAAGAPGSDVDGDGVEDVFDVCPNTPLGTSVDATGRPVGNVDGDCDTDMRDFALMQISPPGPDDIALFVANMTGPLRCGIPASSNDIELRYVLRRQASEEVTACALPSPEANYLENGCFLIEIYAADTSPDPIGITCVFFDVDLGDAQCPLSGTGLVVEDTFSDFQSGSFTNPRRADEVGGCTLEAGTGVAEWVLVATIDGTVSGNACFTAIVLSEAETDSSLFGGDGPANVGFGEPFDIDIRCTGVIYDLWPPGGDGFIDAGDLSIFFPCMEETAPFSETCEGLDWNCDGLIDEIDKSFFNTAWMKLVCAGGIDIPACQLSCR